jgi:beta-lactamase superfamily II metal-dependent hydrolase
MAAKEVIVRTYNVGFGDAFLVSIPGPSRPHQILIDCGSIKSNGPSIQDVVRTIIADATDGDGRARLDLVIATHRHRDHVLGFEKPEWDDVEVGEVWMPLTEDPKDPGRARSATPRAGWRRRSTPASRPGSRPPGRARCCNPRWR